MTGPRIDHAHLDRACALTRAAGGDAFAACLLDLAAGLVPGENAQVMAYPASGKPIYLATQDTSPDSQRLYLDHFYRFDPYYRLLRGTNDFGVRRDSDLRPRGYDEGGYYSRFFAAIGVADYLSLTLPGEIAETRGHAGIFVGRRRDFTMRERRVFERLLPALLRLGLAHGRGGMGSTALPFALYLGKDALVTNAAWDALLAGGSPDLAALHRMSPADRPRRLHYPTGRLYLDPLSPDESGDLHFVLFLPEGCGDVATDPRLTPRESEIVRLILAGHDNPGIALRLGIGEGTLRNHRKRLHRKLGLHAERDLFRLHLARLAQIGA